MLDHHRESAFAYSTGCRVLRVDLRRLESIKLSYLGLLGEELHTFGYFQKFRFFEKLSKSILQEIVS